MTKKIEKLLPSVFYKAADEWAGHPAPRFQEIKKSTNIAINKSIKHTSMEATIQSTNRAINIDINVSINVDALKAIIQRGLQDAWQAIKQRVLLSIKQHLWLIVLCLAKRQSRAKGSWLRVAGAWSLPRLYRMVLLMSRAAVRTIDAHPTISNIFLWVMCAACFWAVLTYNFTTHI